MVHTVLHLTILHWLKALDGRLGELETCLLEKSREWRDAVKLGRTCLMDALPMTVGQQSSGYHALIARQRHAFSRLQEDCRVLGMGGTGIGTGLGTGLGMAPGFLEAFYEELSEAEGEKFTPAENFFDVLQNSDFYLAVSGAFKTLATGLSRIASDLRIMSSGPRAGWGEIVLPAVQPGSSIMPGKINPLMPELIIQIGYQVCGHDLAVTMAHEGGDIDLNVWEAVFLHNLSQSGMLLHNGIGLFIEKCLSGITLNTQLCEAHARSSLALATVISETYGYATGLAMARKAAADGTSVAEATVALGIMDEKSAAELLDPLSQTSREASMRLRAKYQPK